MESKTVAKCLAYFLACVLGLATANAQQPTTFDEWRTANFSGGGQTDDLVSGLLATPLNDGFTNLTKYALGLDVDELPSKGILSITSTAPLTVVFERPSGLTDITYRVEYATNLADSSNWVPGSISDAAAGAGRVLSTSIDPVVPPAPIRFARLQIRHSSGAVATVPANLTVSATSPTEATLRFDPSPGATGYLVEALNGAGVFEIIGFVNAGSDSFDASGLIPERAASYRVRAVREDSQVTEASAPVSVTTEFGEVGAVVVNFTSPVDGGNNVVRYAMQIENRSAVDVPLNELTIRYYLTNEGGPIGSQFFNVANLNPEPDLEDRVVLNTVELETPAPGADAFVEFSFPAETDVIAAGGGTFNISGQMHRVNFRQPFTASNDYSFRGETLGVHPLVTLFQNGSLIFGLPPGGGTTGGPSTPIGLRARPMSESAIELTWEDDANNESLYVIERDFAEDTEGFSILATTSANSITFADGQLLDEAQYSYRVRAVNSAGASSLTNVATTSTLEGTSPQFTPIAPGAVAVAPFSAGRLDLTWTDSSRNERGFIIQRREGSGPFREVSRVTSGITSFIDFGLDPSTSYSYRIIAFNQAGAAAGSDVSGATGAPAPESALTDAEIVRFLRQATFGATPELIADVRATGFEAWLDSQLDPAETTPRTHFPETAGAVAGLPIDTPEAAALAQEARMNVWWDKVLTGPDHVRQRLAFALSQIIVVSQNDPDLAPQPAALAAFYDLFVNAPESNFRELLEDVTFSPVMGMYLDHTRNQRANTITGVRPDENYAREIMQLFSIGLLQLNPDGTPIRDAAGEPVPNYNQRDIEQVARVFTGLTFANSRSFFTSPANYLDPMTFFPDFHESGAKNFVLLNSDIPDIAAGGGLSDFEALHDGLANHKSTAPFICRQLIQRTVTSNPSPAYIERISRVFEDNGSGQRGDLKAVFKAILLDYEARSSDPLDSNTYGKQREPIIRLATLLRTLSADGGADGFQIGDLTATIQQAPLRAPSVFNFFEPDFSLPGPINNQGLASPEFQTSQSSTVILSANLVDEVAFTNFGGLTLDFSRYSGAGLTIPALLDLLEQDLMDGRMPGAMRLIMTDYLSGITDLDSRAQAAVYLVATSAEFVIEQ